MKKRKMPKHRRRPLSASEKKALDWLRNKVRLLRKKKPSGG